MTEFVANPAPQAASTNTQTSERRPVWRQPEIEVLSLALVMALAALLVMLVVPDRDDAVRPAGWWAFISVVVLSATGEGFQRGNEHVLEELGKNVGIIWGGRTSLQAGGERAGRSDDRHEGDAECGRRHAPRARGLAGRLPAVVHRLGC